jgi:hypothetical protein
MEGPGLSTTGGEPHSCFTAAASARRDPRACSATLFLALQFRSVLLLKEDFSLDALATTRLLARSLAFGNRAGARVNDRRGSGVCAMAEA